ncbi:unnamed protein product [Parascedosporium putredinis]|uniref:CAAX prenyl protease n=1 Tax=Parascedosporium putredinis TaxID=1442378 RepID=A0A9P1GU37_9PEZI|nr:unnamed protein product [Parascedosporium putredinis]CAI7987363.1 unnamed protein product [Parascedosporium putredinis]
MGILPPLDVEDSLSDETAVPVFHSRLARALDRPLFPWKKLIMGFAVGEYLLDTFLTLRQYRVLQKPKVPKVLEHEVTQEVFDKSQDYGRAKARFSLFNNLYGLVQNLAFIHFDVLPKMWDFAGDLLLRIAPEGYRGEICQSIVFVIAFTVLNQALSLPSTIYHTFVLEEKYGFNKQTPKLFVTDLIKSNILTFLLIPPILAGFLTIIQKTGNQFFFYLWLFAAGLQAFMITVYPIFILPFFNKLSPLEPGELKTGVEALAASLKFPLQELSKHIVLYDTLIEKSENSEVIAVLAHELGHWHEGHTTKRFGIIQLHFIYIFTLFSVFVNNASLYSAFGFVAQRPIIIGFLLFSDVLTPTNSVIQLLMNILSRHDEFEADAFASRLGYKAELARSLIKLQIQNLSTMDADWMYASYHYSHPILSERLGALGWTPSEKVSKVEEEPSTAKTTGRDEL